MRTFLDCVPCFVMQALRASRLVTSDEAVQERTLRRVLEAAGRLEFDKPPPHMGREIHRIVREETGSRDPSAEIKRRSTEVALAHLDAARERVEAAEDPFEAAVRFAIAGNVMDFALASAWDGNRVEAALEEALTKKLARSDVAAFRQAVRTDGGLVIFVGCAHRGLLNSIAAAQEATGEKRVRAVLGGAHLRSAPWERIERTAEAVARLEPELWLPTVVNKSGNRRVRSDRVGYVAAAQGMHLLEKPQTMSRAEVFGLRPACAAVAASARRRPVRNSSAIQV